MSSSSIILHKNRHESWLDRYLSFLALCRQLAFYAELGCLPRSLLSRLGVPPS